MKQLLIILIDFYQKAISPSFGHRCRFVPSCSEYAKEAFAVFGVIKGFGLAIVRLSKCHPWGKHGLDPLPNNHRNKI